MSRFGSQYQVARHTGVCASSGVALDPGDPCIAALCERSEDEGFDRVDFAIDAWDAGGRPEGLFSFWRTLVPEPNERRSMLVDDDVLIDLFERLEEDDREQRRAFRFVLALILMRKRLLKFEGRVTDDATAAEDEKPREIWRFRHRGARATGEDETPAMEVLNPHLTDDDVRELTTQLSEVLQGAL